VINFLSIMVSSSPLNKHCRKRKGEGGRGGNIILIFSITPVEGERGNEQCLPDTFSPTKGGEKGEKTYFASRTVKGRGEGWDPFERTHDSVK